MRVLIIALVTVCFGLRPVAAAGGATVGADAAAEELIVFIQPGASELADGFEEFDLLLVLALADEMAVPARVVALDAGAPAAVRLTPLIAFQNHRGRSIYQGRYTTLDRLRTMIRTARVVPQSDAPQRRTDVPVWRDGRAAIAAPVKITDLGGRDVPDLDAAAFRAEAMRGIAAGMERFDLAGEVMLGRGDRSFYIDFYPYFANDRLYLSTAVFSQFHCHEPIFRSDAPVEGAWADRAHVFARAAAQLEGIIVKAIAASTLGDGFDVVPKSVPVKTWEELGLALPPKPEGAADIDVSSITLGRAWTAAPAGPNAAPAVLFNFAPPLDYYTGEAPLAGGALTLGDGATLGTGATGWFEVATSAVTMGEPGLDATIRGEGYLEAGAHPRARFTLERFETSATELTFGRLEQGVMHGRFTLRGRSIPIAVTTSFEPAVAEDGRPRLRLDAAWSIRLKEPFDIMGPDGPDPARDTLSFRLLTELVPAE